MPADFYDLLDVSPDASPDELKRAYRAKAREYHPDVNADERSSQQFKAVRAAYDVLSDASERKDYDRMGHRTYVEKRLGGLPGSNDTGTKTGGSRSGTSARQRTRARSRRRSTSSRRSSSSGSSRSRRRARSSATGSSQGATGSASTSKSKSQWGKRTISQPGARGRARRARKRIGVWPVVLVAAIVYGAGLGLLLVPHATVLADLVTTATTGAVDPLLVTLQGAGFVSPFSFVLDAMAGSSPGLLFPTGAVLFPLVLAGAAWATSRPVGWLWTLCGIGPLAGVALAFASVPTAFVVDLVLFVALPFVAVLGGVVTAIRSR